MFWSYLGLEVVSIAASIGISMKSVLNSMKTLGDNGYRMLPSKDYDSKNITKKKNKFKQAIDTIILFIPGVNLIPSIISLATSYNANYLKKKLKDTIVELTDDEKNAYDMFDKTLEKILFLGALGKDDEKEKREWMIEIVADNKTLSIDEKQKRMDSIDKIFNNRENNDYDTVVADKNFVINVPKEKTENNEKYFDHLEQLREKYYRLDELLAKKEEREANINNQLENEKPKVKIK